VVESLSGWWELAGVDSAVRESTVDLLAQDAVDTSPNASVVAAAAAEKKQAEVPAMPAIMWPNDIAALRQMVVSGAPLPGSAYGPVRFPSVGPVSCEVMVISDLPDILPTPETMKSLNAALLNRMLAAIGIDSAQCYCTWLATSMPSTAEVPENDLPDLAAFMLHQIQLIRPKSLVILGSAACKALLGKELMNARAELQNVNHDGLNITTLATFHPRTLIARLAMKKQAWRDLQMFAKRVPQ
jgi:uracil-DNA glycosylase family 4